MLISELLNEIEIGGGIDHSYLRDLQARDFDSRQMDLFPDIQTLQPHLSAGMQEVGRIASYVVVRGTYSPSDPSPVFILFDKGHAVGYVALDTPEQSVDWLQGTGWSVATVEIDRDYAGQNLAVRLYEWILRNFCDYLLPGDIQTRGGVAVWRKLLNSRRFDVEVFDPDRWTSRRRRAGKDFNHVYDNDRLRPFVTLKGRAQALLSDGE